MAYAGFHSLMGITSWGGGARPFKYGVTGVSGVADTIKYMKNKDKMAVTSRREFLCMLGNNTELCNAAVALCRTGNRVRLPLAANSCRW